MAVGLYQFFFKFIPEPQNPVMGIKFANLIQSIPNEDEIDSVYFWERKAHQESVEITRQHKLRVSRLNLVFPLLWSGDVHVKWVTEQWERAHLLFHDRRLAWWSKESDIDDGQPCQGQLLLYGHAGVMQASLVDVRETGGDEDQIVVIFGRDCDGRPIKCAVLCCDSISCRKLEDLVKREVLSELGSFPATAGSEC
jgi:hypothetical protein